MWICRFFLISVKELLHQCQLGIDRWSIMGKFWSTLLKNVPWARIWIDFNQTLHRFVGLLTYFSLFSQSLRDAPLGIFFLLLRQQRCVFRYGAVRRSKNPGGGQVVMWWECPQMRKAKLPKPGGAMPHTPLLPGSDSVIFDVKNLTPLTPHYSVWKPTAGQRLIYGLESFRCREQVLVEQVSSLCIVCQVVDLFQNMPAKKSCSFKSR